jgi:hypothetical protein
MPPGSVRLKLQPAMTTNLKSRARDMRMALSTPTVHTLGQKPNSNLLWISADPGWGKSVLASFLVDHFNSSSYQSAFPATVCFSPVIGTFTYENAMGQRIFWKYPSMFAILPQSASSLGLICQNTPLLVEHRQRSHQL